MTEVGWGRCAQHQACTAALGAPSPTGLRAEHSRRTRGTPPRGARPTWNSKPPAPPGPPGPPGPPPFIASSPNFRGGEGRGGTPVARAAPHPSARRCARPAGAAGARGSGPPGPPQPRPLPRARRAPSPLSPPASRRPVHPVPPHLVVHAPLLLVRQHLVRLRNLPELGLRLFGVVGVAVRVPLAAGAAGGRAGPAGRWALAPPGLRGLPAACALAAPLAAGSSSAAPPCGMLPARGGSGARSQCLLLVRLLDHPVVRVGRDAQRVVQACAPDVGRCGFGGGRWCGRGSRCMRARQMQLAVVAQQPLRGAAAAWQRLAVPSQRSGCQQCTA